MAQEWLQMVGQLLNCLCFESSGFRQYWGRASSSNWYWGGPPWSSTMLISRELKAGGGVLQFRKKHTVACKGLASLHFSPLLSGLGNFWKTHLYKALLSAFHLIMNRILSLNIQLPTPQTIKCLHWEISFKISWTGLSGLSQEEPWMGCWKR